MASIAVAESSKSRKPPKTLSHLEIHAKLGGGHTVKHVYQGYEHPSKDVHFNEDGIAKGGEHIQDHLDKHAGLPSGQGYEGRDESETDDEISA